MLVHSLQLLFIIIFSQKIIFNYIMHCQAPFFKHDFVVHPEFDCDRHDICAIL